MEYRTLDGRETARAERRWQSHPEFELLLVDGDGRKLVGVHPQVSSRGCGSPEDPLQAGVFGCLPLHPAAVAYELRRGELILARVAVSARPPAVPVPRCRTSGTRVRFDWTPRATGGEARGGISYDIVAVMDRGRRFAVIAGLAGAPCEIDLALLPVAGKGRLYLVANDGVRSAEVEACAIDVPERLPTVHILAPSPDQRLPAGQPVSLLGCCLDMGGEPCSPEHLLWLLDGTRFARGTQVAAIDTPAPGRHRLTLAYRGKGRMKAETSITLDVEEPDVCLLEWRRLIRDCFPDEIGRG